MPETTPRGDTPHQSGGLAVALSKLDLDALTVADAVADVASMAGENVTTQLRSDFREVRSELRELRTETNARIDTLVSESNARSAETNARIDTLVSESNARSAETNARIDTLASESNARFAETNARIDATNARIDATNKSIDALQREMATLRWFIGIGFTLLGLLVVLSTFLENGG